MEARQIIDMFGGQSALAELLGKGQSTIAYWAKTGVIPARWLPKLYLLAVHRGISLTAEDLVGAEFRVPPAAAETPDAAYFHSPPPNDSSDEPAVEEPTGSLTFSTDSTDLSLRFEGENQAIWASAEDISRIFGVTSKEVLQHIQRIYADEELEEKSTTSIFTAKDGTALTHFHLDVVLSVGYRVNARQATHFRKWATQTLRAYLEQGYVINEKVLRESPESLNRLAARVRSLRSEEKQVYAKVRECFKISSSDYDSESPQVKTFYALLQDKFHHAVTGSTASKLIMDRADWRTKNMGLQSMKGSAPKFEDAKTGKNYLTSNELYRLHLLSEQFLLYAESTALANKKMTMQSLHDQLDRLLELNNYQVFDGHRDYLQHQAIQHAKIEYGLYRKRLKIQELGIPYDEDGLANGEYDALLIG